ncbi:hypothetical protein Cgig2_016513 [Carnegiea gigantea]|uniref:Uncharacterized protein n=1 Tax=Carnegiea gigantea TaxID=171969 RepID=A0A9Q1JE96_9CARY|nr:hypothetical protein Cgig2_016513 [Carnegiea gigantea]
MKAIQEFLPINANEKERCITIENNARKLEELGLSKLADQSRMKTPNEIKGKEKLNRNDEDEDYIPAGDCEDDEFVDLDEEANEKYDLARSKSMNVSTKEISAKNFENREQQENVHIMGNTIKDSQLPSKRKMFEETRARKEGWTYKQPNGNIFDKIKELEAQKAKLDDVIPKALAQLQKLVPDITLEMMAQAFVLSVDTTSDANTRYANHNIATRFICQFNSLQQLPSSPSPKNCLNSQHFFPTHSLFLFVGVGGGEAYL